MISDKIKVEFWKLIKICQKVNETFRVFGKLSMTFGFISFC